MAGAVKAVWEKAALVAESGTVIAAVTAGNELVADGTKISVSHTAGALRWEVSGASAEEDFQIHMRGLGSGDVHIRPRPVRRGFRGHTSNGLNTPVGDVSQPAGKRDCGCHSFLQFMRKTHRHTRWA